MALRAAIMVWMLSASRAWGCSSSSQNPQVQLAVQMLNAPINQPCYDACEGACDKILLAMEDYLRVVPTGEVSDAGKESLKNSVCVESSRPVFDCSQTADNLPKCQAVLGLGLAYGLPQTPSATAVFCEDPTTTTKAMETSGSAGTPLAAAVIAAALVVPAVAA
mmetsp:Transcript_112940/g.324611  ORF Transcript_112940/g.324611 Transcript_112940/m.324611 type:complete len:164 (-) Transcript_112940:254-745(-)